MESLDRQCDDEIERIGAQMDRAMDRMQTQYENKIKNLEEQILDLQRQLHDAETEAGWH